MVLKIAHRGASYYAPENTIEAFKKALTLRADAVEFDVHHTKDGQIIIMHDYNVKRTTDGAGLIKDLTLKQIKKFHEPNGEPVPTLQEALNLLKKKCICKIEIKDKGIEKKVLKIIKKNRMTKSVIITSKIFSVLKKIKKMEPKIKTETIFSKFSMKDMVKETKKFNADFIAPHYSKTNKKFIEEAHKNGLKVYVWTINTKRLFDKMKKMGVDGITSDYF